MSQYDRKDRFYQQAKADGYRSRAAFKLKELDSKYKLLKGRQRIIDLGAWPGGWLQVADQLLEGDGKIVGIDLVKIDPLSQRVLCIQGDVRDQRHLDAALAFAGGKFQAVLSDMSPKLTGISEVDRAAGEACLELAFDAAQKLLENGGNFVCKVFKSPETDQFVKKIRGMFNRSAREELDSTRKTSNESYVLGIGYRAPANAA